MTIPRWEKANLTYFFASATLRAFRPGPAGSGVMTPTRVATPTTGAALCPSRHVLLPHPPVAAMLARIPPIDVPPAMQHLLKNALPFAIAASLGLTILPVRADSTSSASSAGSSASTSLGSSSASLGKSTDSSSSKERVAQGHYTVVDMAVVEGQPDLVRLRLQALAAIRPTDPLPAQPPSQLPASAQPIAFELLLPREAAERGQLAAGRTVAALHRPYGLAFATVTPQGAADPFFLVLDDAWHRELAIRPVGA